MWLIVILFKLLNQIKSLPTCETALIVTAAKPKAFDSIILCQFVHTFMLTDSMSQVDRAEANERFHCVDTEERQTNFNKHKT